MPGSIRCIQSAASTVRQLLNPLAPLRRVSPLARRLVVATVAFSTAVALLATGLQLYLDYRRDLSQIEATFRQIEQTNVPTLANALWATNKHELQVALDGLVRLPDVRYAEISEQDKPWAQAGQNKTQSIQSRDYVLTFSHRNRVETIGTLHVVIDLGGIYQRLLEKFWVILISNSTKTFLVAGFMLWLFHWLVTRHLHRIAAFATNFGADNLRDQLTLERPAHARNQFDEFDLVLDGFARMQANLATAVQTLEQDILKLERAETQIQRLNAELEQRVAERTAQLEVVNRELEAFSYSVSHDLRAPLRSIDGFSQALAEDYGAILDAAAHDYLDRVRHAAQRMGVLIDDLLRLSRVTRIDMTLTRIDLSALAHEVIAELNKDNNADLATLTVQPGLSAVGDPALLRIVLENLLDNACKYSSKAACREIEFGRMVENGGDVYFVRDNGAGFDMAYVDKLFGAFQRLHREDEFPGTGVGLATVKRIIHRHGGKVWAQGCQGEGAVFYFTLGGRAPAEKDPLR